MPLRALVSVTVSVSSFSSTSSSSMVRSNVPYPVSLPFTVCVLFTCTSPRRSASLFCVLLSGMEKSSVSAPVTSKVANVVGDPTMPSGNATSKLTVVTVFSSPDWLSALGSASSSGFVPRISTGLPPTPAKEILRGSSSSLMAKVRVEVPPADTPAGNVPVSRTSNSSGELSSSSVCASRPSFTTSNAGSVSPSMFPAVLKFSGPVVPAEIVNVPDETRR